MGMTLAAGRWVTSEDSFGENVVINETAACTFGLMTTDPHEAIGGELGTGRGDAPTVVVGVVRDVHLKGPREEIAPLYVQPLTEYVNTLSLSVQLASGDARALDALGVAWQKTVPEYPFDPRFVSDAFAEQLREDKQLGQLFAAFGLIAIVLACMGVFGLAAHEAERRTKEIGIRKVLGASVSGIVARLSGEFARLVVVAIGLAVPVTMLLARRWLDDFAYPAPLAVGPFVLVALGVLALALLASGVHAVRVATADPIRSLRSD